MSTREPTKPTYQGIINTTEVQPLSKGYKENNPIIILEIRTKPPSPNNNNNHNNYPPHPYHNTEATSPNAEAYKPISQRHTSPNHRGTQLPITEAHGPK